MGISEQEAKEFIYFKESSNNLAAQNSGGCKGLGQDCNGQLEVICPDWTINYACQDKFFNNYVAKRYSNWVNAYNHWIARIPINGKDVGNWY